MDFSTPIFEIQRGVCQGDTLSTYLFIMTLKLIAIQIRQNEHIRGIKVDNEEIKLVTFADDMTTFVTDKVFISCHDGYYQNIRCIFRTKNKSRKDRCDVPRQHESFKRGVRCKRNRANCQKFSVSHFTYDRTAFSETKFRVCFEIGERNF